MKKGSWNSNVEGGGKGKKKTYQDNYALKTFAPTPAISNINFTSSFLGSQINTHTNPTNN